MTPKSILAAGAIAMSLATLACGSAEPVGSAEGDASEQGHAQRVLACGAGYQHALDEARGDAEIIQSAHAYEECLSSANDAVVPSIEANLKRAAPVLAGNSEATLRAARSARGELCALLVEASDRNGGTAADVRAADCPAGQEANLAALIDAYVDLGVRVTPVAEQRAAFADCYAVYDRDVNNSVEQATYALANCIHQSAEAPLAEQIASQLVRNQASDSADAASADVNAVLAAMHKSSVDTCSMVAEAGRDGGGILALRQVAECQVATAAQLASALESYVWNE